MRGKFESAPQKKKFPIWLLALLLIAVLAGGTLAYRLVSGGGAPDSSLSTEGAALSTTEQSEPDTRETTEETTEQTTEETTQQATEDTTRPEPEPLTVVSTASICATGDLLMHMPVVNSCLQGGTYRFDEIFQYLEPYSTAADYAVANLETTLCGTDNGYKYSGYPQFNCPDEIVDGVKSAGFDMLLTANNHCYDTGLVGVTRTLRIIAERELDSLGTTNSAEDPKYRIVDINGIRIGFLCYTYSTTSSSTGRPVINGIATSADSLGMINTFDYNRLDVFYSDLEAQLADMEAEGAEGTVLFIHWGNEYELKANSQQTAIAQELCDLGIDVIIGGHPHVVQPMELLTSTEDPNHKTVCLYSMGNAVSNQRQGNLNAITTAHTEDGVLFSVTFARYSDGTVALQNTDLIPCWVRMPTSGGTRHYYILPLDPQTQEEWVTLYDLSDTAYSAAVKSYERTMALVGEGLEACQTYLADAEVQRMADYLASQQ